MEGLRNFLPDGTTAEMGMLPLVIDNDPDWRRPLERVPGAAGHRVVPAPTARPGTRAARARRAEAVTAGILHPAPHGRTSGRGLRQVPTGTA